MGAPRFWAEPSSMFRSRNANGPASPRKGGIEMINSSVSESGRKPLSSRERARFERYIAQIFTRLGMDLDSEPCKRTPHRWVQALVDMTEGYNGDPNIEVVFKRECVNCAQNIPTVQIVEGPIDFASLCEHHVLPFIGHAYIGCLRHEKIIGLSKFTRIVRKYARRIHSTGAHSPRSSKRTGADHRTSRCDRASSGPSQLHAVPRCQGNGRSHPDH